MVRRGPLAESTQPQALELMFSEEVCDRCIQSCLPGATTLFHMLALDSEERPERLAQSRTPCAMAVPVLSAGWVPRAWPGGARSEEAVLECVGALPCEAESLGHQSPQALLSIVLEPATRLTCQCSCLAQLARTVAARH